MIPAEAHHLKALIFAVAKARGVAVRAISFRLEHEIPVVRFRTAERNLIGCRIRIPGGSMSAQKVLTVSGPSRQWSRSWHRKLDGSFDIWSAVDFLVALVQHELAKPLPPELHVPKGLPAACSGLHVVHLAAVRLGVLPPSSKPEGLVDRIENNWILARIKTRLQDGGLHDADVRILADVAGLSVGRPNKWDGDPFEPFSDRVLPLAVVGKATKAGIERRYLLVVEHTATKILVADPAGYGLANIAHSDLLEWCKLGAKRGIPWIGLVGTLSE
jgi:hypothetical protein